MFILVVQQKFKRGNEHRKSVSKQIGEKNIMKKIINLFAILGVVGLGQTNAATLAAGDIAIVAFQASGVGSDSFSFATLKDVDAGTIIYFTDNGYSSSGTAGFRGVTAIDNDGNENLIKFTVGTGGLLAGKVVSSKSSFYTTSATGMWTTSGLVNSTTPAPTPTQNGNFAPLSFTATGEQFTAFTSSNANQPLLSGFTALYNFDNTNAYEVSTSSSTGELAPGLVQGTSAVLLDGAVNTKNYATFNFAAFTGSADQATWLTRFGTASNWTLGSATTDAADGTFGVVPEPSAQALLGIGMAALMALRAVRRGRGES